MKMKIRCIASCGTLLISKKISNKKKNSQFGQRVCQFPIKLNMLPNNSAPRNLLQRNETLPHKEHLKMYITAIFIIGKKKTKNKTRNILNVHQ